MEGIFAQWHYKRERVIGHSADGIGSKILFDLKYGGELQDCAKNLVAMNMDDLSCEYITPSHFWDVIDIGGENNPLKNKMIAALRDILSSYNVELSGGETANLCYLPKGVVVWNGFVYGNGDAFQHRDFIQRRASLEEGLILCAIPDTSLGSNGFTHLQDLSFREEFIIPCRIYTPEMDKAREHTHFFAHITGGGYRNISRVLPEDLDAVVRLKYTSDIFKYVQDRKKFSDKKMFETFHMGSRLVVATRNPAKIISIFGDAFIAGELKKGNGNVIVNGIKLGPYSK